MAPSITNLGVPNIPYFTPQHPHSPGTPLPTVDSKKIPTLFTPLKIRGTTLRNRILVAPMCQYSTDAFGPLTGALTDYHIATLGHYAMKGASLVCIEGTGVQPNGRISPNCSGLWSDAQIPALRRVSDFIKSQGALSAIQLAHAGRKSSTMPLWLMGNVGGKRISLRADESQGGWPDNVVGPMGGQEWTWDGKSSTDPTGGFYNPRALSEKEIGELVQDWASAAQRAVKAGIDVIEIHAAHGYLINEFLSPVTNQRTDKYGGSFENRIRILIEIIQAVRAVIPESMPLFMRISATEWLESSEVGKKYGSWDVESSVKLAKLLPGLGVDLLDVSSAGNHPQQSIDVFNSRDYQTRIASLIREELKKEGLHMFIGAVGLITEAEQAKNIVEDAEPVQKPTQNGTVEDEIAEEAWAALRLTDSQDGKGPQADVILVARQFLREPEWVLKIAYQLGVDVAWPVQFLKIRFNKRSSL